MGGDIAGVANEGGQVVEGVGLIEFAGVDQAHEDVAHSRSRSRAVEQRFLRCRIAFLTAWSQYPPGCRC